MLSVDHKKLSMAASKFSLRVIVLFGSHAKGKPEPGPNSDVDVAVLGCGREDYWDCCKAVGEAISGPELDMVRMEDADPLFRYEIMRAGVLLDGDPDLFYELRAFAYKDFIDSADLFALEETLFRKKMTRLERMLHDSP